MPADESLSRREFLGRAAKAGAFLAAAGATYSAALTVTPVPGTEPVLPATPATTPATPRIPTGGSWRRRSPSLARRDALPGPGKEPCG